MKVEDWKVTLTSSHRGALGRQVKEDVRISNEGLDSLLNSKNEFGANNLIEVGVSKGNYLIGGGPKVGQRKDEGEERNGKKKR